MKDIVLNVKLRKCTIIFIGYIALIISSIVIWIQHLIYNEFHIVFPILFMAFGLGITTPIVMKLLRRDFKLVLKEEGFINRTGFNRTDLISWGDVETITIRNGTVSVMLVNNDEFLASSSLLIRLVAKMNQSTITLVNWYLEEEPMSIYHMMHDFAYQYKYNNLDLTLSGDISIHGVYNTPYLDSDVSMVEMDIEYENVNEFISNMYVFTSLHSNGKRVLPDILFLNEDGTEILNEQSKSEVKRFICFIGFIREDNALITPLGNIKLPKVKQLPDRLKELVDYRNLNKGLRLYEDAKSLKKSELDGTGYVEFSRKTFQSYKDIENWRDDSLYFDLECIEIILMFIPKDIKFQVFDVHTFTKDESLLFIKNMEDYIKDTNSVNEYNDILKEDVFKLDDATYFYLKHINDFLKNKEVVKAMLIEVIDFIKSSGYEFTILGV